MSAVIHLPSTPATHPFARRWLGTRAYWLCQLAGWGGLLGISLLPLPFYGAEQTPLITQVSFFVMLSASGIGVSHLMRLVFLRHLRHRQTWVALASRLIPWIIAFAFAHLGVIWWYFARLSQWQSFSDSSAEGPTNLVADFVDQLTFHLALLFIWAGFYLGLRYYRQHQAGVVERLSLATAVKDAELDTLKAQLNPHFLFNSLNTLRALIPRDQEVPREAVTRLSELLRASLTQGENPTVPLAREMESVENYLALERLRFENRLRVRRSIQPAALDRPVPPFLVQTLVENALKYGLAPLEQGGEITIEAFVSEGVLHVRVTNPGTLRLPGASTGVGLKNSRARLRLLFGPEAALDLVQAADDVVEARLSIPDHKNSAELVA
jgi:hypothetical protein